ncbi:MAG TPA: SigE family RNA polymerase sigma factor [Actinomycetota bacterium]|nr:SigE family RNA polymerase sigma factor [Actinomycetota bacterium]
MTANAKAPSEAKAAGRVDLLYRRHAAEAGRFAYLLTGDRELARDLTQEAFVRVLGRFHDLRNPDAFHWYLRRTILNLARSHFRRRRLERAYLERKARQPDPPPAESAEGREDLWEALLRLPARQRAALVLRFYEDLTEAQAAEVLECPVGTVKSLVSRGLARLRE